MEKDEKNISHAIHKMNERGGHGDAGNHSRHEEHNHHAHMLSDFKKRFFASLVLTVPVLILSGEGMMDFKARIHVVSLLSSFVYFYGGKPFLIGFFDEVKNRKIGMMTLIASAISVSYVYSLSVILGLKGELLFGELTTLIDVMLLGHWIEMKSVSGTGKALKELVALMPSVAHRVGANEEIEDILIRDLKVDDSVLIRSGEKIPVDGIIFRGETSIDESMLTGESKLVFKKSGDWVVGGSANGDGAIFVRVEKVGKDSYLSQIAKLIFELQKSKSKTQQTIDRVAFWLTISALFFAFSSWAVWFFALKSGASFAIERAVSVMVVTCPHALGLAVPLVVSMSASLAASRGFLIRNRSAFERVRKVNTIVFDKTGTLTKGEFEVSDVVSFSPELDSNEILNLASSVDANSNHPIAKGIIASKKGTHRTDNFKSIPGIGSQAVIENRIISVVGPNYFSENRIDNIDDKKVEKMKSDGKTVIYVLMDGEKVGVIALQDSVRENSRETIDELREMGIKTVMLTGDSQAVARRVSEEIGIDEFFAEVLPDQKVEKIAQLQEGGRVLAMVGDGVNDAPSLVRADIGIAIGSGSQVAIESGDIILATSNPKSVVSVINLSKSTYAKMIQNIIWAIGYNIFAIPVASGLFFYYGIAIDPSIGAVFMSLSTVIVAVNARLLRIEK